MTKITKWDMADSIKTPEDELAHLEAAFEDGDAAIIAYTIGAIARARGMTKTAKAAGISRETLYKSFDEGGNPTIDTLTRVLATFGMRIKIERYAASS